MIADETIAQRRIVFGPLAEALAALELRPPVAILGSARSIAAIPDDALPAPVRRFEGSRLHNPRAVVEAAGALVDAERCATVVAVGSSSAIDLGKAVADGRDVALVTIPTALGGAEMTRGYGVLEGDRKTGGRLRRPAPFVVYDAALLASLPARELGSIGINAWAHCVEASYVRTPHALGEAAAHDGGRALPALLLRAATHRDATVHRALFEAAHLGGFAIDTRSMGLHHAACHVFGGLTGVPHGVVNAIVLPHAIRVNAAIAPDALARAAMALAVGDLASTAESIAAAYELPRTFAEAGAATPGLAARAAERIATQPLLQNNPAVPDAEAIRRLCDAAVGA